LLDEDELVDTLIRESSQQVGDQGLSRKLEYLGHWTVMAGSKEDPREKKEQGQRQKRKRKEKNKKESSLSHPVSSLLHVLPP
jgi:hypothetical protein